MISVFTVFNLAWFQMKILECNSFERISKQGVMTWARGGCYWRTFIPLPFKHCKYTSIYIKRLNMRRDLTYPSSQAQYDGGYKMNFEYLK